MLTLGAIALSAGIPLLLYSLWLRRTSWFKLTGMLMVLLLTAGLVIGAVATTVVVPIGYNWAQDNKASDTELYDAYEAHAGVDRVPCSRDGNCVHTYTCDVLDYDVPDGTDSNGRPKTRHVHEEHQCPEATEEDTFYVDTTDKTVGRQLVGPNRFPVGYRPYRSDSHPATIAGRVGVGAPQAWLDAKARIAVGTPGLVVAHHTYTNWILATQNNLGVSYADSVKKFQQWNILPAQPDYNIRYPYNVTKVYFEGLPIANEPVWRDRASRYAAALGTKQGDFHLVIINDPSLLDYPGASVEYINSLIAKWQSKALGKVALSKNGFVVVLYTTDGLTVKWAAAGTGMPKGNEELLAQIHSQLQGKPLDPNAILGNPQVSISPIAGKPGRYHAEIQTSYQSPDSLEDMVLFGPNAFVRQCMNCKGVEDAHQLGYSYLKTQIVPDAGQVSVILLLTAAGVAFVWALIIGIVAWFQTSRSPGSGGWRLQRREQPRWSILVGRR